MSMHITLDRPVPAAIRARHEEASAIIRATPATVFAALDEHAKLSSHMSKPSWRTGGATMTITTDEKRGKAVGSHIVLRGRVLGIDLFVDEVVTDYAPPVRKTWETVGVPRLLVIGGYRMWFETVPADAGTRLTVAIDYDLPASGLPRLLGRLFGRMYAKWCTRQMVTDAVTLK